MWRATPRIYEYSGGLDTGFTFPAPLSVLTRTGTRAEESVEVSVQAANLAATTLGTDAWLPIIGRVRYGQDGASHERTFDVGEWCPLLVNSDATVTVETMPIYDMGAALPVPTWGPMQQAGRFAVMAERRCPLSRASYRTSVGVVVSRTNKTCRIPVPHGVRRMRMVAPWGTQWRDAGKPSSTAILGMGFTQGSMLTEDVSFQSGIAEADKRHALLTGDWLDVHRSYGGGELVLAGQSAWDANLTQPMIVTFEVDG